MIAQCTCARMAGVHAITELRGQETGHNPCLIPGTHSLLGGQGRGVSEKPPNFFNSTWESNPGSLGCEPRVLPLHHEGCVGQIFETKRLVEEYLGKHKKLYAAFMDLEKVYDRVDREALWSVLKIYGVGGQLLKGIQAFYREANVCVRVGAKFSEGFAVEVGVRQRCAMSPWLFNIFVDGCMREIKCKVGNAGAKLRLTPSALTDKT